jgi:hypothetical protein
MSLQREFAEILKEKMGSTTSKPSVPPAPKTPFRPFPHWKYEFSSPKHSFFLHKNLNSYPQKPLRKKQTQTQADHSKLPPSEPVFKIGQLGLEYTSDLMALQTLGADLKAEAITLSQIKKEYRKLARRYHPDHNKNSDGSERFQMAHRSYRNLVQAITEKTRS